MVRINGKTAMCEGKSISEYLKNTDYNLSRIALELNGEIVPKSEYENTIISDGDEIEIVSFVGGG